MAGKTLGNIVEIMKRDFKSAFSNPIVTIVLLGIIILPSLYALINIQACWDPYEETSSVEFAIANLDNGTTFEGNTLNIGNELVKDLKNNDKFKWTYVTEKELRDGVHKGDYYAGIVIPKNLTENVVSIMDENPKQAELEYIVNVKANPVAAKLTDSGANAVYTQLNAKIVQFINLAAYGKLGELQEGLASGAGQLASGGSQLQSGSQQISSGASQVSSGVDDVKDGSSQVQEGASKVQDAASGVDEGASKVKDSASKLSSGANSVKEGSSQIKDSADQLEQGAEQIEAAIDPSQVPAGPLRDYVEANIALANGTANVAKGSGKLADGSSSLADGSGKLADGSASLADGSSKLAKGSSDVAGGASQLADGSVELAEGSLALAAGSQLLSNSASQALYSASGALSSSANSLSGITGINESLLGDYFYSPIKLNKHELFPVDNYGSQVAPFYIVLSMWVGALITCAMLKPGTAENNYSSLEMYFGKLLLFVVLSILQAVVTIIGSFLLGIHIVNPILFVASALIVSVVFMVFTYSLVSALGNVGKAISIVLLVIQISGTGGIYPVEIMNFVFQDLNPYLPMTYAITLMREAQLGIVWTNYLPALTILLCIGAITVVLMLIIKTRADKRAHYFEERLEESGLF